VFVGRGEIITAAKTGARKPDAKTAARLRAAPWRVANAPAAFADTSLEGGVGKVENAGITVKISASCGYSADLDPKDAAPSVLK